MRAGPDAPAGAAVPRRATAARARAHPSSRSPAPSTSIATCPPAGVEGVEVLISDSSKPPQTVTLQSNRAGNFYLEKDRAHALLPAHRRAERLSHQPTLPSRREVDDHADRPQRRLRLLPRQQRERRRQDDAHAARLSEPGATEMTLALYMHSRARSRASPWRGVARSQGQRRVDGRMLVSRHERARRPDRPRRGAVRVRRARALAALRLDRLPRLELPEHARLRLRRACGSVRPRLPTSPRASRPKR